MNHEDCLCYKTRIIEESQRDSPSVLQITKPTSANKAVKAAKRNGKKVTTSEAKKIASKTRKKNISKKEANAVINGYADSAIPISITSSIKGTRKRAKDEKEK